MDLMDSKEKLHTHLEELSKRLDAVRKLPEYKMYTEYLAEFEGFCEFVNNKRIEKTFDFIKELISKDDDGEVKKWVQRLKDFEKKQSDLEWKRGYTFCASNVMDHLWEVFSTHGKESEVESMFGNSAFTIGGYKMEMYSGQGEYGYSIYAYTIIL